MSLVDILKLFDTIYAHHSNIYHFAQLVKQFGSLELNHPKAIILDLASCLDKLLDINY